MAKRRTTNCITPRQSSKIFGSATGIQVDNKGDKPAPVDVFTVEVTPEEAERLSLAAVQGKLHFALRNVADRNMVYTLGSTVGDALEAYRPRMQKVSEPAAKMEPQIDATQRRVSKIFVINGADIKWEP